MLIGGRSFNTERDTYIMGILNVTPDSFSDGGRYNALDKALEHAQKMVDEGVAILDIGGESTHPGYTMISDEEEIDRVLPVIERVKKEIDIPVSVDTYKSGVAAAALDAGADMINDIWGLKYDPHMAEVIAKSGAACCLMHNRKEAVYDHFLDDCLQDLQESLDIASRAGIRRSRIILDPGIGFAKDLGQNLKIMKNLDRFHELGLPLLLGASRKSMIGLTLGTPVDQRLEGTLVTTVLAVQSRYSFVRVHDVLENKRAIWMQQAIARA